MLDLIVKIKEGLQIDEAIEKFSTATGTTWDYETIGSETVIKSLMRRRELTEYAEINFRPYITKCPLPKNVLNTFEPLYLHSYIPNKEIKVEDTLIYEYLCRVFGHSDKMNNRLGELLDRVAFKLQYPWIRTGRIHAISASIQGIGKSCFFKFLSMIFSSKYCVFHDNLDTYLSRFNGHLHSKLIHFVDDLSAQTGKIQTRKLYSRVTSNHILMEKKGENIVRMDEFSELWITGNQNACSLHVCAEDRRIVIYKANPCLKGNKAFWLALT